MNYYTPSSPIPALRDNLRIDIKEENGQKIAVISDIMGYAPEPIAIPLNLLPLIKLFDGKSTPEYLEKQLKFEVPSVSISSAIINIAYFLNSMAYLHSPEFEYYKLEIDNYKASSFRPAVCAGTSYPIDKQELEDYLKVMQSKADKVVPGAKAIISPHIDFRIGDASHIAYANAYESIKDGDFDLAVIFGTAHFGNSDVFMITEKNFETPLGLIESDKDLINNMKTLMGDTLTFDDMTHKNEHSIELQLVWLQYIFKNKNMKILPILTGSFHNFMHFGTFPKSNAKYNSFINSLNQSIAKIGRKPVFIASADMAHIGRKFDDNFDAEAKLDELKIEDYQLIDFLRHCDHESFYAAIANIGDINKICGFAPIYSLIETVKPQSAKFLNYHIWHEVETRSAVSFSSFAFY